jgi:hypothetical protein
MWIIRAPARFGNGYYYWSGPQHIWHEDGVREERVSIDARRARKYVYRSGAEAIMKSIEAMNPHYEWEVIARVPARMGYVYDPET